MSFFRFYNIDQQVKFSANQLINVGTNFYSNKQNVTYFWLETTVLYKKAKIYILSKTLRNIQVFIILT